MRLKIKFEYFITVPPRNLTKQMGFVIFLDIT